MKTLGYRETMPNNQSTKRANKNRADRKRTLSCDNANDDESDTRPYKRDSFKTETRKLFERDVRKS